VLSYCRLTRLAAVCIDRRSAGGGAIMILYYLSSMMHSRSALDFSHALMMH
jgi:hypothetical protein